MRPAAKEVREFEIDVWYRSESAKLIEEYRRRLDEKYGTDRFWGPGKREGS